MKPVRAGLKTMSAPLFGHCLDARCASHGGGPKCFVDIDQEGVFPPFSSPLTLLRMVVPAERGGSQGVRHFVAVAVV